MWLRSTSGAISFSDGPSVKRTFTVGGALRAFGGVVSWESTALYFASLLSGSFGALLLSPEKLTVGASGAVFGLMGAGVVFLRARGIDPMQSGLGPTILINLAFTFLVSGISIGGHLGGLAGGALAGWAVTKLSERRSSPVLPVLVCAAIGLIALAATYFEARAKVGL